MKQAAVDAIQANHNQYTRPGGHPEYVQVLADMYAPLLKRRIDPMKEVVTFNGGQEGIASIMAALLEPVSTTVVLQRFYAWHSSHPWSLDAIAPSRATKS